MTRQLARLSLILAAISTLALAVPAQSPPAGFTDQLMATGLSSPCGMDFMPDGRIIVCERTGNHNDVTMYGFRKKCRNYTVRPRNVFKDVGRIAEKALSGGLR